jgi:hypothetical protein
MMLAAMFLAAFGFFLATMSGSFEFVDGGELAGAAATLGIPHPPGYPFHTLFLKLLSGLPAGGIALRMGLAGPLSGALCAVLTMLLAHGREARKAGLLLAFLLATSPLFWLQTAGTKGSVYVALCACILAGLVLLENRGPRLPVLAGLLAGVAMAVQAQGGVALALAMLAGAAVEPEARRRLKARSLVLGSWFCAAALALYLALPLMASRHPPIMWGGWDRFAGVLEVLRWGLAAAAGKHGVPAWSAGYPFRWPVLGLFAVAVAGNIAGILRGGRPGLHLAALLLAVADFAFLVPHDTLAPFVQHALPLFVCALAGLLALPGRRTMPATALALSALLAVPHLARLGVPDMSRVYLGDDLARNLLSCLPPGRSVLLGFADFVHDSLVFRQAVLLDRPDVPVVRVTMAGVRAHGDHFGELKRRYPWLVLPPPMDVKGDPRDLVGSAVLELQPPALRVFADPGFIPVTGKLPRTLSRGYAPWGMLSAMGGRACDSRSLERLLRLRWRGLWAPGWHNDRWTRFVPLLYASAMQTALRKPVLSGRRDEAVGRGMRTLDLLMADPYTGAP